MGSFGWYAVMQDAGCGLLAKCVLKQICCQLFVKCSEPVNLVLGVL